MIGLMAIYQQLKTCPAEEAWQALGCCRQALGGFSSITAARLKKSEISRTR
jgi:hypothetical protein